MKTAADTLETTEYAYFYQPYLTLVQFDDLPKLLTDDLYKQLDFIKSIPIEKLEFRYAANKWSVAEVILHMTDAERVFSYRALRFARNDKTELPGFDENNWVKNAGTNRFSIDDLIGQFKTTRNQTIAMYKGFDKNELLKMGSASNCPFSVRALGYMILGHNRHHIEKIKTLYLR
jgi:hypothetical protein